MDKDYHQLALDTLHDRSDKTTTTTKSCFIYNEAGASLRSCDKHAIPVLEELFETRVAPAMQTHREQNGVPDWNATIHEKLPFAGLGEFIGAYWVVCARVHPARAVKFISKMPKPVVNESASQLAGCFRPLNPLADVPIPKEYIEFLNSLSNSDIDEYQDVANYVFKRLQLRTH